MTVQQNVKTWITEDTLKKWKKGYESDMINVLVVPLPSLFIVFHVITSVTSAIGEKVSIRNEQYSRTLNVTKLDQQGYSF